jgi:hypothetical protein
VAAVARELAGWTWSLAVMDSAVMDSAVMDSAVMDS